MCICKKRHIYLYESFYFEIDRLKGKFSNCVFSEYILIDEKVSVLKSRYSWVTQKRYSNFSTELWICRERKWFQVTQQMSDSGNNVLDVRWEIRQPFCSVLDSISLICHTFVSPAFIVFSCFYLSFLLSLYP